MKHVSLKLFLRTAAVLALVLGAGACEVGPDYQKPEMELPASWHSAEQTEAAAAQASASVEWWQNFHDPLLTQFVRKAAADNFDVKIAEARIEQARAAQSSAFATLLPKGDVKAEGNHYDLGKNAAPGGLPGFDKPINIYQTGFDASWELDLFGGHRRDLEGAVAQVQSAEASRDDAMISLLAEVARTYIDIRQYQAQLALAQDIIKSSKTTVNIAQQRFTAGSAPGIDLMQARAQLEQVETQLPYYQNLLKQSYYAMDILLAEQPGYTEKRAAAVFPVPTSDKKLVLNAPAAVIADRPDIRMAERNLASATAQQGVATAKFFPDISLSGFFGLISTSSSTLLQAGSKTWFAGGEVLWPILDYGHLSANLDSANAQQQEAMLNYRKAIITALADVERSVTSYTEQDNYRMALGKTVDDNQRAYKIAQERYKEGLTSFIDVLDAERTLYTSQSQLANAAAQTSQNLVATYKSLGGGWTGEAPGALKPSTGTDNSAP